MTTQEPGFPAISANGESPSYPPIPVIVYLSGGRRGTTERLAADVLEIGTAPDAKIRLHRERDKSVAERHATLHRRGQTYEIEAEPGHAIWVNGESVERMVLASGDILEIGAGGPVLRFRLYEHGTPAYKSVAEVFADCMDCARHGGETPLGRAALFLAGTPKELMTQTSRWFRVAVVVFLLALAAVTGALTRRSARLEERLAREVSGLTEVLRRSEESRLSPEDLAAVRVELQQAEERLQALEARSAAGVRVIAAAAQSTVFLQGSYGFVDPASGRAMRLAGIGSDGQPLSDPDGNPLVGLEGNGPIVEAFFTGTAFVASDVGLLLTNRHVALPWEYDESVQVVTAQGLVPTMTRFLGYLPGIEEPFEVELVLASDQADVAVLRCGGMAGRILPMPLSSAPPELGDAVIVLGYPTGIRALLARAGEQFVEELLRQDDLDFWTVARRLAEAGHIAPLASRGIVGQVTPSAVVYDAETTRGGSGGPVLNLDGQVVAVNVAILPEFGGSNLGVPAAYSQQLLETAARSVEDARPQPELSNPDRLEQH